MNQRAAKAHSLSLAEKLSRLVQFQTVSSYIPEREDDAAFSALLASLPSLFPNVDTSLETHKIGSRAMLYTWPGKDPRVPGAIFCAHFDVVPALNPETWEQPPFSGTISEGQVWGRGTQDIKVLMACILEAAEVLLGQGFSPHRTLHFAFGGDEETGGHRGARQIAAYLQGKGVKASFLLDEGGSIAVKMLSFARRPLALVGVAEKGYMDVKLESVSLGGHASMPPRNTAPGNLARALAEIEARQSPARLTRTLKAFLAALAGESSPHYSLLFSNLWLSSPLVLAAFSKSPATNALIRTTRAITMLQGSPKENVLAEQASATVNVRVLPGETCAQALDGIRRLVERQGVQATAKHPGQEVEASSESRVDSEGFAKIKEALAISHPEAACLPFLFSAATDTKHYAGLTNDTYRLTCLPQTTEDLKGIHGINERVRIIDMEKCADFYKALIQSL
ncbi:MAG: carboxypeptidase PM20D1 [Spirochaetes bacterium]|nr:MAG: carboxypeptidase PM20D1 [Spirochaetota bacterium]